MEPSTLSEMGLEWVEYRNSLQRQAALDVNRPRSY